MSNRVREEVSNGVAVSTIMPHSFPSVITIRLVFEAKLVVF